ncbi:alkaline phosphatase family protein [Planctomonas psychrotolerans]|uniref:alkaline phosphatase family protein n=1 Tax=Planctomonas psychrotolerans TaxID=2528712 RepID=UPI001238E60E|nr:alkaline phosphatase family protein [Planctomonas psychrotolerans]
MLPARQSHRACLADVLPSCLAALDGAANPLALGPVDAAVVVLADGLGNAALRARAGHARTLTRGLVKADVLVSGFPSTTAAAIASFATGVLPGEHGLVGYTVLDPANDRVVNQLSGWDEHLEPDTWQRSRTQFERAREHGIGAYSVGPTRYASTGYTRAVLRGSEYVPAGDIGDRFAVASAVLDRDPRSLVYVYVPELDVAAHASGWESDRWLAALEALDAAVAAFSASRGARQGLLVTADHGMLDVPPTSHVLFDSEPDLVAGVRHVAGDPRCLQLHLEPGASPGDVERLAGAWRDAEGGRSFIATRDEAIDSGWFGDVAAEVRPRMGDVFVAARARIAYYDSRETNPGPRRMVGQHGSLSPEELQVPLVRLGAFAR